MTPEVLAKAGPKALTPDVPHGTIKEAFKLSPKLKEAAANVARLAQVRMLAQQRAIAQELRSQVHKNVDGLGTPYLRVTQEEYFAMRAKYGDGCWEDPKFVDAYHRDNSYARVPVTRNTRGNEILNPTWNR